MNIDYAGTLDLSFDHALRDLNLPWLPWVGSRYCESQVKTIVLGESVYDFGKGIRVRMPDSVRRRHMEHGILQKKKLRYLQNFQRAVFLKKHPSVSERVALWSEVIYHNLVLDLMTSQKARPTPDQYSAGWKAFLPFAQAVGAQRTIVYGLERPKIQALIDVVGADAVTQRKKSAAIRRSHPQQFSISIGERELELVFIRHPSAFFAWDEWGAFLHASGALPPSISATAPPAA